MTRPTVLSEDDLASGLADLDGWERDGDAITKSFRFAGFAAAFAFMAHVAVVAAELDHHPEWFNVFNRVDVRLSTHDAGGVTQLDLDLAAAADAAALA